MAQRCRHRQGSAHEYHSISNRVIWDAIKSDFPDLKKAIEAIKESIGG